MTTQNKESLYTKYRPRNLSELVGQEHIKKSLTNAVKNNRLSHAYLFAGPKGIGKTSIGRILAMIVNCENGPSVDYDINSRTCNSIVRGHHPDVQEMDAATKTGIDDVRELRSQAFNAPIDGRKRIFIVDEAHQLSKSGGNALLRVLEEPPSTAMFVLLTTEPNKILPTVQSRCQRFNLRKIGNEDMANHLEFICQKENTKYSGKNIFYRISKQSNGSLRDAVSLLDIILARCGDSIDEKDISDLLSDLDQAFYCELLNSIAQKNKKKSILLIKKVTNAGSVGGEDILRGLYEYTYDILICKSLEYTKHMHIEESIKSKWEEQYKNIPESTFLTILKKTEPIFSVLSYMPRTDILLDACVIDIINSL